MSSGFVSGGTAGEETERDAAWKAAAQELEDARKAKEDLAKQHDGKSLYEILQENKDKKQAEFEEKARFKLHNALDDDEADYLDSVLQKKQQEEAKVKKETREQLDLFRQQQEEAERSLLDEESKDAPKEDSSSWAVAGRKRKKGPETSLLKGIKPKKRQQDQDSNEASEKRKDDAISSASSKASVSDAAKTLPAAQSTTEKPAMTATAPLAAPQKVALDLGYGSSDDED